MVFVGILEYQYYRKIASLADAILLKKDNSMIDGKHLSKSIVKKIKNRNKINYNNSNKIELDIFSTVKGKYLYIRAKARGIITLNIIQYKLVQFLFIKSFK